MQTNLRKVGGSVMMALPPVFLEELKIGSGSSVDVVLSEGQLVIKPITKPKYSLADLLAQCDPNAKISEEDREWLNGGPAGNESL